MLRSNPYYEWTYDDLESDLRWIQQAADNVLGENVVSLTPEWQGAEYAVEVWVYAEKKAYTVDPSPDCDPVKDFLINHFADADWSIEGYEIYAG